MNIAEITENRNALDKMYGVKLKHPDKVLVGERFVDKMIMMELNPFMTKTRLTVNGIVSKNVGYDADGTISATTWGITKSSCLRWKQSMTTTCKTFELRWVDRLIEELVGNHQLKVVGYKTPTTDAHSEDEWAYINIVTLCDKIFMYSQAISENKARKNLRLEIAIRSMGYKNSDSFINGINELIKLIDEKTHKADEIIVATLIRMALVAATGSVKYPNEFTDKEWLKEVIYGAGVTEMLMTLGAAIEKRGECLPYTAFKHANPCIISGIYKDINNKKITEALYSLTYLSFIMDDKYITKLIKNVTG
jgi:hypothetical protein